VFDRYNLRMTPRPVYVTPGRQPFEVAVLAACLIVGTSLAVTGLRPPTLTRGLTEPILSVWLILMAVGGGVGLLGVYWRGSLSDGMLIEFAGVVAVAGSCLLYVAALFALNPLANALGSGGLLAGIAAGAAWRAVQTALDWRRVRRARVSDVDLGVPLLVEPEDPPQTGGSA
jgi:hypothetical protein